MRNLSKSGGGDGDSGRDLGGRQKGRGRGDLQGLSTSSFRSGRLRGRKDVLRTPV